MKQLHFYGFLFLLSYTGYTQTVLNFRYDAAGNQVIRRESVIRRTERLSMTDSIPDPLTQFTVADITNKFSVSPNPTKGYATLSWDAIFTEQITSIELTSLLTNKKTSISRARGNAVSIDLSSKVSGLYVVTFYLKNTTVDKVQKKIIKL